MAVNKEAGMAVAVPDPFYAFGPALSINGVNPHSVTTPRLSGNQVAVDPALFGRQEISALAGGRSPYTAYQQYTLDNSNSGEVLSFLKSVGMDVSGILMTPAQIAKMGGGDFDGDTVQLMFDRIAKIVAQSVDYSQLQTQGIEDSTVARDAKAKAKANVRNVDISNRAAVAEQMNALAFRSQISPILLGAIETKQQALSGLDPETYRELIARGNRDLAEAYDVDTTFVKTGVIAEQTKAMMESGHFGSSFQKVFKNIYDAVGSGDFSSVKGFDTVALPSMYSSSIATLASFAQHAPMSGHMGALLSVVNNAPLQSVGKSVNELLQYDGKEGQQTVLDKAYAAIGRYHQARNLALSRFALTGEGFGSKLRDTLLDQMTTLAGEAGFNDRTVRANLSKDYQPIFDAYIGMKRDMEMWD